MGKLTTIPADGGTATILPDPNWNELHDIARSPWGADEILVTGDRIGVAAPLQISGFFVFAEHDPSDSRSVQVCRGERDGRRSYSARD